MFLAEPTTFRPRARRVSFTLKTSTARFFLIVLLLFPRFCCFFQCNTPTVSQVWSIQLFHKTNCTDDCNWLRINTCKIRLVQQNNIARVNHFNSIDECICLVLYNAEQAHYNHKQNIEWVDRPKSTQHWLENMEFPQSNRYYWIFISWIGGKRHGHCFPKIALLFHRLTLHRYFI